MMAAMTDPPRLVDESGSSAALRAALRAGREDLPSEETLLKVAAGLAAAPLVRAGAAKVAALAGKGLTLKLASAVVVAAVAGGGVAVAVAVRNHAVIAPPEPPARVMHVRPAPIEPAPSPPEVLPLPPPPQLAKPHRASPPPPPAPPRESEIEITQDAQRLLAADPRAALRLLEKHEQRFADGEFVQEREVIAIDALVRLGQSREAAARARRFEQRFPDSAHLRRVQALVQKSPAVSPLNGSNGP
jgi:hypothetical protein